MGENETKSEGQKLPAVVGHLLAVLTYWKGLCSGPGSLVVLRTSSFFGAIGQIALENRQFGELVVGRYVEARRDFPTHAAGIEALAEHAKGLLAKFVAAPTLIERGPLGMAITVEMFAVAMIATHEALVAHHDHSDKKVCAEVWRIFEERMTAAMDAAIPAFNEFMIMTDVQDGVGTEAALRKQCADDHAASEEAVRDEFARIEAERAKEKAAPVMNRARDGRDTLLEMLARKGWQTADKDKLN